MERKSLLSMLCLEGGRIVNAGSLMHFSGMYTVKHQCRQQSQKQSVMEESHARWKQAITLFKAIHAATQRNTLLLITFANV